jgi:hypothetical protein
MKNNSLKNRPKREIVFSVAAVIGLILFTGCESFVEIEVPDSQLTAQNVFKDKATAQAALANSYIKMQNNVLVTGNFNGISNLLGSYADELNYYGIDGQREEAFYKNVLLPSNSTISEVWNNTYNLIYASNAIIEGVTASTGIPQNEKGQLIGEALFLRAYLHFYLVNLFGDIPYVTTTDYKLNTTIVKKAPAEVYDLIIEDLENAKLLISDEYPSDERVRPNKSVVEALLARAYLYHENWDSAEAEANLIINNTSLYGLEEDIDKVFLKDSPGTLWQLMPQFAGNNTFEAQSFIFFSSPPPVSGLSNSLIESFELGDLRRDHWVGTVTDGLETWYFANKYKENNNTGSSREYSILFRLEEIYLIRAEARTHLGNISGAQQDLNKIRHRAGLSDTPAVTQSELLMAILKERQLELFTELGHRWFDINRFGVANKVLETRKTGWNSTDILWPLPQSELLLNGNLLPQNPGY